MTRYEYKVVPAPRRAEKHRDGMDLEDRFALTLAEFMNRYGSDGWEFIRCETLDAEDKKLLGKAKSELVTVMIFRRPKGEVETSQKLLGSAIDTSAHSAPRLGPAHPDGRQKTTAG